MRAELELLLACAGIECGRLGDHRLEGQVWTATFYYEDCTLTIADKNNDLHQYICLSAQRAFELTLEHHRG